MTVTGKLQLTNALAKHISVFNLFRPRMTEIAFVLKAVATLISTLKKTPSANGKFCKLAL